MSNSLSSGPRRRARRRAQRRRRILGGLVTILVVTAVAAAGWLVSSLPKTSGRVVVAGIAQPVEIIRDQRGIPNIYASDEADAFYGLGFVHAQDRLFQMDFMRMAAQGRLAEVIGPQLVDSDRFMRMLDLVGQAEATLQSLEPRWRQMLDAYAAGVNASLDAHWGALPPEYLVLGHTPERWQPRDSLLWAKLMGLQLSGNWRGEIARAGLATKLSPAMLEQLWPDWPTDHATTLALADLYRSIDFATLADALPTPLGPAQASNEWVVAGQQSASGKPVLANDPHLGLGAPGVWYLARIVTPNLTLVGATAPGAPAVVLGHNGHIAWGFTTTNADTWDLFIERLDPTDPNRYLTPDGPRPFETRTQTMKVKGQPDAEVTFRATRHGPVLSDLSAAARATAPAEHVVAIATPSMKVTDRTPAALFALNRATDWNGFVAAMRDWHGPMQNIVYADRAGHIGFYSPALLPRRPNGDGWLPTPGWTSDHDWDGYVPFVELPHAFDPPQGRLVNANNRIVPDNFPAFITRDWDSPYRARRIAELLDARTLHDSESMAEILRDDVSLFARDLLPRLRAIQPSSDEARRALALMQGWNGDMDRLQPQPLIFNAWMRELAQGLIAQVLGPDSGLVGEYPALVNAAVAGTSPFCAEPPSGGRTCAQHVAAALDRALASLAAIHGNDMMRWRWGDAHYAPFRHQVFSKIPVVRDLVGLRVPTDGDFFTINRGATRLGDTATAFEHVHGAGLRAIYDLADLDASHFMVTPGQSGNPLSRHWSDLARDWSNGLHFTLESDRARLQETGSVLILAPANGRNP
jgi:penicillin amidase